MLGKSLIQAAAVKAGAAGGLGIEDVFSTWLYTGNGSTQTITNGIDLAGEGGLVWIKGRNGVFSHALIDTERTRAKSLASNTTEAEKTSNIGSDLASFDSDGFTLGPNHQINVNNAPDPIQPNGYNFASWTFRKAPGFFDMVTFTAGSSTNRRISHSLGSAPGMIIMKRTDGSNNWAVYHRSLGRSSYIFLDLTSAAATQSNIWGSTDPTSTDFGIDEIALCVNGASYVAYLFAHDEQIFGEGGDQSVIKCGSYTGNGSTSGPIVDLGWEPQWVMVKRATGGTGLWLISDNMRGIFVGGNDPYLSAESSNAEVSYNWLSPLPTGFQLTNTGVSFNSSGETYVYIAIRRGPMKTPTSGTEVFSAIAQTGSGTLDVSGSFPPDLDIIALRPGGQGPYSGARLTGATYLTTSSTTAEGTTTPLFSGNGTQNNVRWISATSGNYINWLFRRAPGFFDVVAYTGDGVAGRYVNHGLAAAPEMIITKCRNSSGGNWVSTHKDLSNYRRHIYLNSNLGQFPIQDFYTEATSSSYRVWKVNGQGVDANNASGENYIAYLFATLPGISKVFNFTGNGTSQTIDCGFAAGARFVLLKRTDSAGNWLVADTARGIISGNDPLLYLNSAAAEITTLDWIDPHSSGFIVNQEATANANVGGATYIGLAIA